MTTHPTDPIEEIVKSAIYERRGNKPETWCFAHAARLAYVAGLREAARVLNTPRHSEGTCSCNKCQQTIQNAHDMGDTCEICGYAGPMLAWECCCYEHSCAGSDYRGMGCPHGSLTCPVCAEGEVDISPWLIIKELRATIESAADRIEKGTT